MGTSSSLGRLTTSDGETASDADCAAGLEEGTEVSSPSLTSAAFDRRGLKQLTEAPIPKFAHSQHAAVPVAEDPLYWAVSGFMGDHFPPAIYKWALGYSKLIQLEEMLSTLPCGGNTGLVNLRGHLEISKFKAFPHA